MSVLTDQILKIVNEQIAKRMGPVTAVGTLVDDSPTQYGSYSCKVMFDGSALAVPVKKLTTVDAHSGDRVCLIKFGVDWTVVGSFTGKAPEGMFLWNDDNDPPVQFNMFNASGNGGGTFIEVSKGVGPTDSTFVYITAGGDIVASQPVVRDQSYTALSLSNGWTNFGTPYPNVSYLQTTTGHVLLQGEPVGGTGTDGTVIATLPSGRRPLFRHNFPCLRGTAGKVPAYVSISTDGTIKVFGVSADPTDGLSLAGVMFSNYIEGG